MASKAEIHPLVERVLSAAAGSIHDLAADLGVSYATLYAWTTARRKPSADMLARLAEIADARADELRDVAEELRALAKGEGRPPGPNNSHGRIRRK